MADIRKYNEKYKKKYNDKYTFLKRGDEIIAIKEVIFKHMEKTFSVILNDTELVEIENECLNKTLLKNKKKILTLEDLLEIQEQDLLKKKEQSYILKKTEQEDKINEKERADRLKKITDDMCYNELMRHQERNQKNKKYQ